MLPLSLSVTVRTRPQLLLNSSIQFYYKPSRTSLGHDFVRPFSILGPLATTRSTIRSPPKVNPKTINLAKPKVVPSSKKASPGAIPAGQSSNASKYQKVKAGFLPPAGATLATRVSEAFINHLLSKGGETPLYQAPSHIWYTVGSLGIFTFCIGIAAYQAFFNAWLGGIEIKGLAPWIPYAYGGVSIVLAAMGTFFFIQPARVVAYIKAVPTTENFVKNARTNAAKKSRLLVEVGIRRPLLGWEPKRLIVAPSDISMPTRLSAPVMTMTRGELIEIERQLRDERIAEIKYDKEHLMTAPLRQMHRAFREFFKGTMRAFSMEGFADIIIDKKRYKIDILGGWALEDGKAIDKILMTDDRERM